MCIQEGKEYLPTKKKWTDIPLEEVLFEGVHYL